MVIISSFWQAGGPTGDENIIRDRWLHFLFKLSHIMRRKTCVTLFERRAPCVDEAKAVKALNTISHCPDTKLVSLIRSSFL